MSDFHFAHADRSYGLLVLPLLALLLGYAHWRARRNGFTFLSKRMQDRLVSAPTRGSRIAADILFLLACGFLVVTLMQPQWGLIPQQSSRVGAEIMICLDVSKSMLAEDVAPNRLERAKADIRDLLGYLEGEQVGLMAFAGRPVMLSPMTSDFGFLKLVLDSAGPHNVGRGGTRLEPAIQRAVSAFQEADDVSKVILLITDGGDTDSQPELAVKVALKNGVRLIIIGFGDESGTTITVTDPRTGVRKQVTDSQGNRVVSRLDGKLLRELAAATRGVYIPAGTSPLDLADIHRVHFAPLLRAAHATKERAYRYDGFQYPLALAIGLLVAGIWIQSARSFAATRIPQRTQNNRNPRIKAASIGLLLAIATHVWADTDNASVTDAPPLRESSQVQFNRTIPLIKDNREEAKKLLEQLSEDEEADFEVRFRANYNLGWIAATDAEAAVVDDPSKALEQLDLACDCFQEAVSLHPQDLASRQNLEVVARRRQKLRDAMQPPRDPSAEELEKLAKQQEALNQQTEASQQQKSADDQGSNDTKQDTEDASQQQDPESLKDQQESLAEQAEKLAQQMKDQGEAGENSSGEQSPSENTEKAPDQKQDARKDAAERVESAAKDMQKAADSLGDKEKDDESAQQAQADAIRKLREAQQLMAAQGNTPNPEEQPQKQPNAEPQQQASAGKPEDAKPQGEPTGMAQLLQLIRDRESQRMHERSQGQWVREEPVAEDW